MDLLISLAYSAATSKTLDEPLPTGIGLMVPPPDDPHACPERFDEMSKDEVCGTRSRILDHLSYKLSQRCVRLS